MLISPFFFFLLCSDIDRCKLPSLPLLTLCPYVVCSLFCWLKRESKKNCMWENKTLKNRSLVSSPSSSSLDLFLRMLLDREKTRKDPFLSLLHGVCSLVGVFSLPPTFACLCWDGAQLSIHLSIYPSGLSVHECPPKRWSSAAWLCVLFPSVGPVGPVGPANPWWISPFWTIIKFDLH